MHTIMTYLVASALILAIVSDTAAGYMFRSAMVYLVTGAA